MLRQLVSKVQDVDLISPLAHIAEEAFNGVRGLNVSVHGLASTRKMSRGVLRDVSELRPREATKRVEHFCPHSSGC
jgi:hypothetical protein